MAETDPETGAETGTETAGKDTGRQLLEEAFGPDNGRPTLGKLLGFQYEALSADEVVVRMPITPDVHQPYGIVHGGTYAVIAEEVASIAGQIWLGEHGSGSVVGVNNNTDFLRAAREGVLRAVGTPIHRGRTQQLWQVEIRDEQERLIARSQVRLANIGNPDALARS